MKGKSRINLGCIIKVLVIIALIMGVLFLFLTCSGGSCIQKIDKTLPDIQKAPWEVTTETNLYYAVKVAENSDKSITMSNWYERIKGKWINHADEITLSAWLHPKIRRR